MKLAARSGMTFELTSTTNKDLLSLDSFIANL
ncbi:MAG: hypothetical protein JWM37_655 [Candidatus Saccharibacteria bacterium]|nr:hypothetical protein [Candidatus Saccharibacteria bacterium]